MSNIDTYDFPSGELELYDEWMREKQPFAVVGSNTVLVDNEGNMFRGRQYPWGKVNIEDNVGYHYQSIL